MIERKPKPPLSVYLRSFPTPCATDHSWAAWPSRQGTRSRWWPIRPWSYSPRNPFCPTLSHPSSMWHFSSPCVVSIVTREGGHPKAPPSL